MVTDWWPQFKSQVWESFCHQFNINVSLTSGFNLQVNGQVERVNQEIGCYLHSYCIYKQHQWSTFLPLAEYTWNSLIHWSTWLTPFQCVLGYEPLCSLGQENPRKCHWWARRSERVGNSAHVQLQRVIRRQRVQEPSEASAHRLQILGLRHFI